MRNNKPNKKKPTFFKRHKLLKTSLLLLAALIIILIVLNIVGKLQQDAFQNGLNSFYDTAGLNSTGPQGEIIRSEPVTVSLQNGTGRRVLYRTQRADGSNTFTSGMIYVPSAPSSAPRPVMAWAHGTLGMGDSCAPSRRKDPIVGTGMSWVDAMLARGWVVAATDYAGLGTPGVEAYLVGQSEAHDVLNSVRAAKNLPGTNAGNSYAIWGHSQGGHSALFSASLAPSYMPEYQLVGTAASAPAAQLESLLTQQFDTAVSWLIGPEVVVSWPDNFAGLNPDQVLSTPGAKNYQATAEACINDVALAGIIRAKIGQKFFTQSLMTLPEWKSVIAKETAPVLSPAQPLFVAESLTDQVVLPNTTAQYIQRACQGGSNLTSLWLNNVGHIALQGVVAPSVTNWLGDRFAGRVTAPTCNQPLPITPATN
ncbi:hypothetical protein EXS66_02695 [Candidatus Saccharibacteria bacterium]|nr:hypothetical protein [Candidatus Saccharibacteria bacterium]